MQITSGLLSIVGAAFLFGTVHALVAKPVDISKFTPGAADKPVVGEGPRGGDPKPEENSDTPTTPETDESPEVIVDEMPEEASGDATGEVDDAVLDAPVPEGTLTLRQSYDLWEQGAYFLDARHEHEYEEGHIQYSFWLASSLFDTDSDRAFAVVDRMPPDATVVIYCVGGECDASHNTARRLQQIGFTDLRIMGVGYSDWVDAGFPTAEGSEP
jgi:rhodanese-related sulfurtransferase